MALQQQVAGGAVLVALGAALVTGGAALAWAASAGLGAPPGLVLAVAAGAALSLSGGWMMRVARLRGHDRAVEHLASAVRRIAVAPKAGVRLPELQEAEHAKVAHAINALLERAEQDRASLRADAGVARSLLDISPSGVLVVGDGGRIRFVNPAFRRLVHLRGEPVGARPIEVIPVAEVQEAVDRVLGGQDIGEVPCTAEHHDLMLQAVRVEGTGVMVLVQDVTRFRQAERARTDFVANVSHELRTPIASIMGYTETLLADSGRVDPELVPMIEAVYRNGQRLRDLFEDLLQLSRIEARRGELSLSRQRVRPILESAVTSAADRAAQRDQEFSLECDPTLEAWVNAEALSAIVGNLAANASNYTPSGGRIAVRASAAEGEVRVQVQDTGIGIDKAHHTRIFERFYRVDEGRSRDAGGTGLGLAIVKHLARASGCTVSVDSAVGRGSEFTVHLLLDAPDG